MYSTLSIEVVSLIKSLVVASVATMAVTALGLSSWERAETFTPLTSLSILYWVDLNESRLWLFRETSLGKICVSSLVLMLHSLIGSPSLRGSISAPLHTLVFSKPSAYQEERAVFLNPIIPFPWRWVTKPRYLKSCFLVWEGLMICLSCDTA